MLIKRTEDQEEIKAILLHESIYPHISGGAVLDFDTVTFPTETAVYIGGYDDDENIVALSCFHDFKDGLKFHPNVLPDARRRYARKFIKHTANMVQCPLYIEIPKARKELFNQAKKFGFESLTTSEDKIIMRLVQ